MRNYNKYNEMAFSEEEKQKLIQIKDAMYSWLEGRQKLIDGTYNEIRIHFGPVYTSVDGDETESYHVSLFGKEHKDSKIWFGNRFSICYEPFEKLYSPNEIYPILDNWEYIKGEVNAYINRLDDVKNKINGFRL